MSIERLPTMGRRESLEDREQARYADYSTHNIIHERRVNDHIGPVITVFSGNVSLCSGN